MDPLQAVWLFIMAGTIGLCSSAVAHFRPLTLPTTESVPALSFVRKTEIHTRFRVDQNFVCCNEVPGIPPPGKGSKYETAQHTIGHLDCPACEAARIGAKGLELHGGLLFREAAKQWLESKIFADGKTRARYVAPRTVASYEEYVRALNRFFGETPLDRISVGTIREYQRLRAMGKLGTPDEELYDRVCRWMKTTPAEAQQNPILWDLVKKRASKINHHEVGPNKVNQEIGVLVRIMKRGGAWTQELEELHEPLQREQSDIAHALTPAQQQLWLDTAGSNDRWQVVYWYSLVAFRTTASNVEMRGLRLGDISLMSRTMSVQASHAKNKFRIRTIALAPDAQWAIEQLMDRARGLGSFLPQHYLFPFRNARDEWNPDKPMSNSGLKKPWNEVRENCGLKDFSPHDTRHTAITRMAEAGTPIPVIMSMAGHISPKMMQHYTQISMQAQRWAVDAVYNGKYYPTQPAPTTRPMAMAVGMRKNRG